MSAEPLPVTVQFAGGAELLFGGAKTIAARLPSSEADDRPWTIRRLLAWLAEHHLRERPEMFLQDGSVRPGILVLVNDVDWELCGALECELRAGDAVLFVSTLHGG